MNDSILNEYFREQVFAWIHLNISEKTSLIRLIYSMIPFYVKLQKHKDNPIYAYIYIYAYKTIRGIILINIKTDSSSYLCG